jgi:LacI family transcriptional regulator
LLSRGKSISFPSMTHRFPIKEIAQQAGLSTATVDRVLNGRVHASPQSRRRVARALSELEAQEHQLAARGRRIFVDIVMEAPSRFAREVRAAAEAVLPEINAAVLRPRFHLREEMPPGEVIAVLDRITGRGSGGVCLKARDTGDIRAAVARLAARGIPVVTVFTDLPGAVRRAYAGLDNRAAGRTAGWLMARMLAGTAGYVLTSKSQVDFAGEEDRFRGFSAELAALAPQLQVRDASGGAGLNPDTARRVAGAVDRWGPPVGVYSMGGGNRAIRQELAGRGIRPRVVIGHDLDADNRRLLEEGWLTAVLEHDLAADMRAAFLSLLAAHRLVPAGTRPTMSEVRVITPRNIPAPRPGGAL